MYDLATFRTNGGIAKWGDSAKSSVNGANIARGEFLDLAKV